jgi:CsoR family transcriptional regulator, copper-sensing transcriptional repressor
MDKKSCHEDNIKASQKTKKNGAILNAAPHPDHGAQKLRLNRVRGQIAGIDRMIDERRYCMDIITQIKAAKSALAALEAQIIETHLRACVKTAFQSKSKINADQKIQEIMEFLK